MSTKTPEIDFREWQVAALVTITIIIVLNSTSPRTAFYSLAAVAVVFFVLHGVLLWYKTLQEHRSVGVVTAADSSPRNCV